MLARPWHTLQLTRGTAGGINLESHLTKREAASSVLLPWPHRRTSGLREESEKGVQKREHVLVRVSGGKNCPGWLSLKQRRDRAGVSVAVTAVRCSPRMAVTVLFRGHGPPSEERRVFCILQDQDKCLCILIFTTAHDNAILS